MPTLILVNGMPGTGKTTLARRLAQDLALKDIGKDDIKEFLFDKLGAGDREWSRCLGVAASRMLYEATDALLGADESCIVESAFYAEFARDELRAITLRHDAQIVEVHLTTPAAIRMARFKDRLERGARHPGHVDQFNMTSIQSPETASVYEPLQIGELIPYDTTIFTEQAYQGLLAKLRVKL